MATLSVLSACSRKDNVQPAGVTEGLSPVEVVELHFKAKKTNDLAVWMGTMTEDKKRGFLSMKHDLNCGLISLEIHEIYEQRGEEREKRINNILESKKAQDINLTADNIAIVYIDYTSRYDGTKATPSAGGQNVYILIRQDKNSPWLIQGWGVGYGGI